jgi:hypothetical protein
MAPYAYRTCLPGTLDVTATTDLLECALAEVRAAGGRALAFPYLRDDDSVLLAALRRLGAREGVIGAGCRVRVRYPSAREHFARQSRDARRSLRRYEMLREDGGVDAAVLGPHEAVPASLAPTMVNLLASEARRHGIGAPPMALYRAIVGSWPGRRTVQWTVQEGRLTGCELGFVEGDELIAKLGGHLRRDAGYVDVGLTGSINLAYQTGMRRVDLGASTHAPKLARGAELYWIRGALLGEIPANFDGWSDQYETRLAARLRTLTRRPLPPLADAADPGVGQASV